MYEKYNVVQPPKCTISAHVFYIKDLTLQTLLLPDNGESFFDDADDRQFNVRTARCILLDFWARQLQVAS